MMTFKQTFQKTGSVIHRAAVNAKFFLAALGGAGVIYLASTGCSTENAPTSYRASDTTITKHDTINNPVDTNHFTNPFANRRAAIQLPSGRYEVLDSNYTYSTPGGASLRVAQLDTVDSKTAVGQMLISYNDGTSQLLKGVAAGDFITLKTGESMQVYDFEVTRTGYVKYGVIADAAVSGQSLDTSHIFDGSKRLPDGNTLVSYYGAHGKPGKLVNQMFTNILYSNVDGFAGWSGRTDLASVNDSDYVPVGGAVSNKNLIVGQPTIASDLESVVQLPAHLTATVSVYYDNSSGSGYKSAPVDVVLPVGSSASQAVQIRANGRMATLTIDDVLIQHEAKDGAADLYALNVTVREGNVIDAIATVQLFKDQFGNYIGAVQAGVLGGNMFFTLSVK